MSTTRPIAPPPPTPKPGRVKVYRALYDFQSRSAQELSFNEGDLLYVSDEQPNKDWFQASIGGQKGLVPANYVVSENVEELPNPLHEAARRGNIGMLTECLRERVSVNSLDKSGATPLYWAAHGGHTASVGVLLEDKKVAVSVQNKLGDTPLHAAAYKGHVECVRMLLAASSNPFIRNQDGKLPLDVTKDADVAALLDKAMKENRVNEEDYAEYLSDSDADQ
uniref:Osteoclast-stimulating factor 1 n=1 Tax=Caenorhabditis tropicalis TaxID=1561998 RepID=A0A1I7T8N9_9PELO